MSKAPALPQTALQAAGAVVTETSLALSNPDLPWDEYERLGSFIGQMNRACAWWVGDLVLYGEEIYGEMHAQIEQALGLAPQTIANRASVARHIPPSRRRASLPFGVHAEVAYFPPKERDQWLARAAREQMTRAELRAVLREERESNAGPVGDLAVTGKSERSRPGASEEGLEDRGPYAAVDGYLLGEPVPGLLHCPNCGHTFRKEDEDE